MGNKKGTKDSLLEDKQLLLTFMIANLPIGKKANESSANSNNKDKKRQFKDDDEENEHLKKREKHNEEVCIMIDLNLTHFFSGI